MIAVKIKQFGERAGSLIKSSPRGLGSGYHGDQQCLPFWLPGGCCLEAAAGKRVLGLSEGWWRLLHCSSILVSFAARKEEGDTCLDVGALAPYFRAVEMRKTPSAPSRSPFHQCLLSPLNSRHALCSHPPWLCICCWLFHSPSPAHCPGTWNHWSPLPALPSEDVWRSSQLP